MSQNVRIGRRTFYGVQRVGLNKSDQAGTVEFPQMFIGAPVTVTLSKDNWNGTCYTLRLDLYGVGEYGVQIGLPSGTSNPNAQNVVKSAITINNVYAYAGNTDTNPYVQLLLASVQAPAEDVEIALFGLVAAAATATATAAE